MPKVISYTPSWLERNAPGLEFFTPHDRSKQTISSGTEEGGIVPKEASSTASRTIAQRGTEIYVVVDNTIRWTDLCSLQEAWREAGKKAPRSAAKYYRTLQVPVHEQIRQLIISPNQDLLAILTSHTAHIAVLPDSSHLGQLDERPIRVKTHTIGSTTHVLSQSPIVKALWHPLGVDGKCLVTITVDAVVRLWELDTANRYSFDRPALAFDVKKLAYGRYAEDDFTALDGFRHNRGYSLDGLDIDVASACFGGKGRGTESGWSAMTLWIAMKGGDIYALCPILPSKWQPPSTLLPSLMTSNTANLSILEDSDAPPEQRRQCEERLGWLRDANSQATINDPLEPCDTAVYLRPDGLRYIPKLQGPFNILPDESGDDMDLADIFVVAPKLDADHLVHDEDSLTGANDYSSSLSSSVICLTSTDARLYLFLDLDGVEAQWLPSRKNAHENELDSATQPALVFIEALDMVLHETQAGDEWPLITPDVLSSGSFFVTHSEGVLSFSMDSWLAQLEEELQGEEAQGIEIRLEALLKSSGTVRERILHFESHREVNSKIPAAIVLQDADLGYFLLTSVDDRPYAAVLDLPRQLQPNESSNGYADDSYETDLKLLPAPVARSPYQIDPVFSQPTSFSIFKESSVHQRHRILLKDPIRLSPSTLGIMTDAHRALSAETYRIGLAAADLFRRCENLQAQLQDQVADLRDRNEKILELSDPEHEENLKRKSGGSSRSKLEERLQNVHDRQIRLSRRSDDLRRKMGHLGGKGLSEKERAWIAEIEGFRKSVLGVSDEEKDHDDENTRSDDGELNNRLSEARSLAENLLSQVREITSSKSAAPSPNSDSRQASSVVQVPPDIRNSKVAQIQALLDREYVENFFPLSLFGSLKLSIPRPRTN
ncbi:hypothetical protein MMC25_005390 [Agyrium rufum]|nr:hypothetical protein [Agyrium rufum]